MTADGACGRCFSMVPLQIQAEVRAGGRLRRCEACGIIFAPPRRRIAARGRTPPGNRTANASVNAPEPGVLPPAPAPPLERRPHAFRAPGRSPAQAAPPPPGDVRCACGTRIRPARRSPLLPSPGAGSDCPIRRCSPMPRPACQRMLRAVGRGETILVHGDYDVDGIAAAALLTRCLRALGGKVVPFVPHRLRDGYDFGPRGGSRPRAAGRSDPAGDRGFGDARPRRGGRGPAGLRGRHRHRPPHPRPDPSARVRAGEPRAGRTAATRTRTSRGPAWCSNSHACWAA